MTRSARMSSDWGSRPRAMTMMSPAVITVPSLRARIIAGLASSCSSSSLSIAAEGDRFDSRCRDTRHWRPNEHAQRPGASTASPRSVAA
jgi:hypothetical protein